MSLSVSGTGSWAVRCLVGAGWLIGCASHKAEEAPQPVLDSVLPAPIVQTVAVTDTVLVTDPALEERVARLELRVLERDAQVEELQTRLDEARQEAVRAMAKLQTLATRAEAASGMAEAEIALRSLKNVAGTLASSEVAQGTNLLQMATSEFDKQNYGGALYLANQAKRLAGTGQGRVTGSERSTPRPGEVPFALPVPLRATDRSNVREGPGTGFRILFTVDNGASLTGYSYTEGWVRVRDDTGRGGWVARNLIERRPETAH